DRKLYEAAWSYHNVGRAVEGSRYEYHLLGGNYRMTEFQAAVLLAQLSRYEEHLKTRMENAQYLSRRLAEINGIRPLKDDSRITRNACHLYVFRYDSHLFQGAPRDRFVEALRAEGIPCTGGYGPWYRAPYMLALREDRLLKSLYGERVDYSRVNVPVTEKACTQEGVWLFQSMLLGSRQDMDDIVTAVKKVKENAAELTA
ncbi:MAG: DegT/DnrJ/EryC1/StrS family aminotransferase, partial [Candidatus Bathyarchaeia archaeon]